MTETQGNKFEQKRFKYVFIRGERQTRNLIMWYTVL